MCLWEKEESVYEQAQTEHVSKSDLDRGIGGGYACVINCVKQYKFDLTKK